MLLLSVAAKASDAIPKEVSLIINGKRLVASNIRFSRFDDLSLNAQERIAEQTESKGIILVVTNQRFIAYGVGSGWKAIKLTFPLARHKKKSTFWLLF